MRKSLLLLCLLLQGITYAAPRDSMIRFKINFSVPYGRTFGELATARKNNTINADIREMWGVSLYLGYHITKSLTIGVEARGMYQNIDSARTTKNFEDKYLDADYYTELNFDESDVALSSTSIIGTYYLHSRIADIEPFLQFGTATIDMDLPSVYRKRKNSNYSEDISRHTTSKRFFFPGVGVRLSKRIVEDLYASISTRYCYGTYRYEVHETTTDFFGNKTIVTTTASPMSISVFELQMGILINLSFRKHKSRVRKN